MPRDTRTGVIYLLSDPRDDSAKYVGKTVVGVERRTREHLKHARDPRSSSNLTRWLRRLTALGLEPSTRVLEYVPPGDGLLNGAEKKWIQLFKSVGAPLCNQTPGGDGGPTTLGRRWSPEQRARMSAAQIVAHTDDVRQRKSEAARRRWQDPAYRQAMSTGPAVEALRTLSASRRGAPGRPWTDEERAAHRERMKAHYAQDDFVNPRLGKPSPLKGRKLGPYPPERGKAISEAKRRKRALNG